MDSLVSDIKNVIFEHGYNYTEIPIDSVKQIHNLLINNVSFEPLNDTEMSYLGLYYQNIKKNYNLMKRYFLAKKQNLFLFVQWLLIKVIQQRCII